MVGESPQVAEDYLKPYLENEMKCDEGFLNVRSQDIWKKSTAIVTTFYLDSRYYIDLSIKAIFLCRMTYMAQEIGFTDGNILGGQRFQFSLIADCHVTCGL